MELASPVRAAVVEHVARIKHDLGKYVAFQVRWLPEEAGHEERLQALRADLLATRRGPDGELDASALWRQLRPALVGEEELAAGLRVDLRGHPDLERLDGAMAMVDGVLDRLRAGQQDEELVERGIAAARSVAEAVRALHQSLREG